MITKLALAVLLAIPSIAAAREEPADQLRKAIVEEEVNQKFDKAIEAYTKILAQYDEDRKVTATALFHLAECHRKLGQRDKAIAAYQRVLQDFADQTALVDASRYNIVRTSAYREQFAQLLAQLQVQLQKEQDRLQRELGLVEKQVKETQKLFQDGLATNYSVLYVQLQMELLNRQLSETVSSKDLILQKKK